MGRQGWVRLKRLKIFSGYGQVKADLYERKFGPVMSDQPRKNFYWTKSDQVNTILSETASKNPGLQIGLGSCARYVFYDAKFGSGKAGTTCK